MSAIAKKKAQGKKGAEMILIYMGYTFFAVTAVFLLAILISDNVPIETHTMVPTIYFCTLGALCWGIAIGLRNKEFEMDQFNDWFKGFIFLGILVGGILAVFIW